MWLRSVHNNNLKALVAKLTVWLILWGPSTFPLDWWLHGGRYRDNWWVLFHLKLTQLLFLLYLIQLIFYK